MREPLLVLGDNFTIPTRTVYLNELFLYYQLGLRHYYEARDEFEKHFGFKAFIYVLAHEIVHAILTDYAPEEEDMANYTKSLLSKW